MALIIHDDYCNESKLLLKEKALSIKFAMDKYIEYLNDILQRGIKDGKTADNLKLFFSEVELLKGKAEELAMLCSKEIEGFLDEVDEKDKYIY